MTLWDLVAWIRERLEPQMWIEGDKLLETCVCGNPRCPGADVVSELDGRPWRHT